jgi:hypothetical protein
MYDELERTAEESIMVYFRVGREDVTIFRSDIREIRHILSLHTVDPTTQFVWRTE